MSVFNTKGTFILPSPSGGIEIEYTARLFFGHESHRVDEVEVKSAYGEDKNFEEWQDDVEKQALEQAYDNFNNPDKEV